VPTPDIARQLAETDAQISDLEIRIIQQQKRVENLLAKGGDAADVREVIATLTLTLADLEARRARLEQQRQQSGTAGR
jgi:hypothetical protein